MSLVAACIGSASLPADEVLLQSVRDALNSGPQTNATWMILGGAVVFIAVIAVLARYANLENRPKPRPQPDLLMRAATVLALSGQERYDLSRTARRSGLACPASMLLSPANLALGVERALRSSPDPHLRGRMDRLSRKLFDEPLPVPQLVQKS